MKKIIAAAALVASGATAQAADLSVRATPYTKAPAVMAQVYDWTGFYFGVNGGTDMGRAKTLLNNTTSRLGGIGAAGGGEIGYNWQYPSLLGFNNVVLGIAADIQGSGAQDSWTCVNLCNGAGGFGENQKLGWFGTVRGRVGLATGPVLSYVTGGFAYGGVNTTITDVTAPAAATSFNATRTGWTLGSGVEAALGGNWTGKLEYLYVSLGTQNGVSLAGAPNSYAFSSEIVEHVFRLGLNYRMGANATYMPEPVANWTGFYAGGSFGGAVALNRSSLVGGTANEQFNLITSDGFTGGGQLGFNWQAANWVLGVETDIQASSQDETRTCELTCSAGSSAAFNTKMQWLGTTRARLGYSLGSTLFYATGGVAYGGISTNVTGTFGAAFNQTNAHTQTGYAVGGGVESPFNLFGWFGPSWTAKTEYLYVDLGTTSDVIVGTPLTLTTRVQEQLLRTGLNYHFNSPVVARY